MARLQTSFWQKIGDESQAVVVRMQELRRIYRSEIITRCTLHFTYIDGGSNAQIAQDVSEMHHKWCLKCRNCGGCTSDALKDLNEIEGHFKWSHMMAGSSPDYELK